MNAVKAGCLVAFSLALSSMVCNNDVIRYDDAVLHIILHVPYNTVDSKGQCNTRMYGKFACSSEELGVGLLFANDTLATR